ncbi:TraB/GumN family protein [Altererythrobacter sp. Z27]|uniref:TraB/GumN family protein n=1 Tax=Altererythrobacter sp. Z27 TaxID=3461147 RepID=UPI00404419A5
MKLTPRKVLAALGVSALAFAAPAFAGQEAEVAAAATTSVEASAPARPALWKVADEDTTIYLFGTVHALPKDVEWSSSVLENALASSDSVVTEIKMTPEMPTEMQQLVMTKGILPADTTLRSLLNAEQTATYEAAMGKLGIPAAAFDRFEPWYAGMMMSMLPLLQQGYSPDAGVEKVILTKAGDKDQQALETIAFQIGIFDQLPQESQVNFLVEASAGIDEIKPMLDRMVAEWLEGDADALAQLMNEGLTDPKVADALLYSRNRNWAQWIDTRLETPGTVFVAVGAGHLAGKESVQDALSELGIETVRVQ